MKAEEVPDIVPYNRSNFLEGHKRTVVWIDINKAALQGLIMKKAGINVQGFHDDFSSGKSDASELAEAYLVEALANPEEHIVAIIVNSGIPHRQMLMNVLHNCRTNKR